jgi:hypothetical protein
MLRSDEVVIPRERPVASTLQAGECSLAAVIVWRATPLDA